MNMFEYKRLLTGIGLCTGILLLTIGCKNLTIQKYQAEIDSISLRIVPDKRVDICSIKAKTSNKGVVILTGETTSFNAKNEIIKTLSKQSIDLIDSIIILPDTLENKKYLGLATLSVINLRKQPDHRSELVSQSLLGTPLLVLKDKDSWLLVQTPDHYIAWTEKNSVGMKTQTDMLRWRKAKRIIYTSNSGWILNSPDHSKVVGDIVAGSILEATGESKGYINVLLPDGRKGCVDKNAIMDFDQFRNQGQADADKLIIRAFSLLGVPYLWGGSSSKGVDCSGFVQYIYFLNGIILTRDASLQALHGNPVSILQNFDKLKKGDLLFFGSKENWHQHVTHVAHLPWK